MSILKEQVQVGSQFIITGNTSYHEFEIGETVEVMTSSRKGGCFKAKSLAHRAFWWVKLEDVDVVSSPLSSHELLSDFETDITVAKDLGNKYKVEIPSFCNQSDVYDVLVAFNVTCPAAAHAIKKLLCAGLRGHKNKKEDKQEAINSIRRSLELDESHG